MFKKNQTAIIQLTLLLSLTIVTEFTYAENDRYPNTRMSVFQTLYSGENNKSFSKTGAGFGGEITSLVDGARIPFYVKGRATYISGEQTFLDNASEVTSSFTYYQGMFEMGLLMFPIARKRSGFNIYLAAGGSVGYNYVSLDNSQTFTELQYSDQAISTGYAATVGGEWIVSRTSKTKWTLTTELSYRSETAKLLKQNAFDLSGITMSLGLGW